MEAADVCSPLVQRDSQRIDSGRHCCKREHSTGSAYWYLPACRTFYTPARAGNSCRALAAAALRRATRRRQSSAGFSRSSGSWTPAPGHPSPLRASGHPSLAPIPRMEAMMLGGPGQRSLSNLRQRVTVSAMRPAAVPSLPTELRRRYLHHEGAVCSPCYPDRD